MPRQSGSPRSPSQDEVSEADVRFIRTMKLLYPRAIRMTRMATSTGASPRTLALA
jgi:uncharacterized protein (DUF305 family)